MPDAGGLIRNVCFPWFKRFLVFGCQRPKPRPKIFHEIFHELIHEIIQAPDARYQIPVTPVAGYQMPVAS
jgi:hypothetical protein